MIKKKAVIILSGGIDSTTLLYEIMDKYEIFALSFDYGQKHIRELAMAKATCKKLNINHKVVEFDILNELAPSALTRKDWKIPEGHFKDENMKQTVIPNRNMVLLSLATSYAISVSAIKLFYGAHMGDHDIYPDCRKEFIDAMKHVIKICDWGVVELEAPYWNMDKIDIVNKGKKLNVDYSLTYTCYKGNEISCGKCGSCVERMEAFKKNKLEDSINYIK